MFKSWDTCNLSHQWVISIWTLWCHALFRFTIALIKMNWTTPEWPTLTLQLIEQRWLENQMRVKIFGTLLYVNLYYIQRSWSGVYWFCLILLSVCPSVDRNVSTLYLLQYSPDPFHVYTPYQATSEGSDFRRCAVCKVYFKIKKFEVLANSFNQ